jgi:hypothetical protein
VDAEPVWKLLIFEFAVPAVLFAGPVFPFCIPSKKKLREANDAKQFEQDERMCGR